MVGEVGDFTACFTMLDDAPLTDFFPMFAVSVYVPPVELVKALCRAPEYASCGVACTVTQLGVWPTVTPGTTVLEGSAGGLPVGFAMV